MRNKIKTSKLNNQNGFTMVELLLVLGLLCLVLSGIYMFFHFTNRTYSDSEKLSIAMQEANLFMDQVEREIRPALKPNEATNAVRVLNSGEQLDIYQYLSASNEYKRISYRLNPDNKTQLQKGWIVAAASSSVPGTTANPQYASIPTTGDGAWKNIVSNIDSADASNILFTDISNDSTLISERRLIQINLKILDPDTNRPVNIKTSCMSRNGRATDSQIAAEEPDDNIPVTSIEVTYLDSEDPISSLVFTRKNNNDRYLNVVATVQPEDATVRDVIWSVNEDCDWIEFAYEQTASGMLQVIKIGNYNAGLGYPSGPDPRTATITVTAADGSHYHIDISVSQTKDHPNH